MNSEKHPFNLSLAGILVLVALHLILYSPGYNVMPCGDDFPVLGELNRGNEYGPVALIRQSASGLHYRPIRSLTVWAFGNLSWEHRVFWLHFSSTLATLLLFVTGLLWMRAARFGPAGIIAGSAALLFHPVMPASIVSLDTVDSLLSSAFLWLGVWAIYRWRANSILAASVATVFFALGCLTKEYVFAMVPLGLWTIAWMYHRPRVRAALIIIPPMFLVLLVLFALRNLTMPEGHGRGFSYLLSSWSDPIENAVIFATALLYLGNTVTVFFHRTIEVLLLVAASILLTAGTIAWGLVEGGRRVSDHFRWTCFFAVALVLSTMPALFMYHVSEVYVPPLVLPFACLLGLAAEGFMHSGRAVKVFAACVGALALGSAMLTIHSKLTRMLDTGNIANSQLQQIQSFLPADARSLNICLVYNVGEMPEPPRSYSVYQISDEVQLIHRNVLDWVLPGRDLKIFPFHRPHLIIDRDYDLFLFWDYQTKKFRKVERRLIPVVSPTTAPGSGFDFKAYWEQ